MKRNIFLIFGFVIFVLCLFIVSSAPGVNLDYDKLKDLTVKSIENAVNKIENAKSTISNNPKIDEVTKTSTISKLDEVITKLNNYSLRVLNTSTLSELSSLNREILKYIKDNKEVIRNNIRMSLINMGQKVSDKSEELKDKTEVLISSLKIKCNDQESKTLIASVEVKIKQLDEKTQVLKTALTSKDTQIIKQEVKKIKDLSKSIVEDLKYLESSCLK